MHVQFSAGADRLTWAYPKLSPQLKKCAAYVLEHPSEVATLSMRQVASRAKVPPSTMTRLARAVGFSDYTRLRDVYRASLNGQSENRTRKAGQLQMAIGETDIHHALDTFREAALLNVSALFDQLDPGALDRAVRALAGARQVLVAGALETHALANYFQGVAALGFRNWRLAARHNGELACLSEPLTNADVVVGIAFKPWAVDTIEVARHGRRSGSRVVGITDQRTSPLAATSDDILIVPIQSPSFFLSYVAATALIEVLAGMVVAHGGPAAIERIGRMERLRLESGTSCRE